MTEKEAEKRGGKERGLSCYENTVLQKRGD